jgi:dTDP-4-amino-4,6-dideoxygalactose transaminase
VREKKYGISRDSLYEKLKKHNIFGRRYFYPLISSFSTYKALSSAKYENLPVANQIADEVICLPIYPELKMEQIKQIIEYIQYA